MMLHKRLLIILLIFSFSFNLFFMFGYARSRHAVKLLATPEGRTEFVSKRLKLNQDQKLAFLQLAEQIMMEGFKQKKQHSREIEIFWHELLEKNPDPQKISAGFNLRLDFDKKLQPLKQDSLLRFLKILTPEQKRSYIDMLRSRARNRL